MPSVSSDNVAFSSASGAPQIWIDQSHANPSIVTQTPFQKYGEVFTVPDHESNFKSVNLTVSAPASNLGGAQHFELKLYEWSNGAPTGPVIYDSGLVALGTGLGVGPTPISLALNVPVQAGHQYIFEIVGDGTMGFAPSTAISAANNRSDHATGGLYVQSGDGVVFGAWQPQSGNVSLFSELDFQPALTTKGTLAFTDVADTHTVSVSADAATTWGNLVAYVSTDTTGSNTAGAITWAYEVDPSKAASLGLGEVHYDTFAVTLTDSSGGKVSTNVTVVVAGADEAPKIVSASPAVPGAQPLTLPTITFVGDPSPTSNGFLTSH